MSTTTDSSHAHSSDSNNWHLVDYITGARGILRRNSNGNAVRNTGPTVRGLDPSIVASFPIFVYSSVKSLRQDKPGLECAVCLSEFEDDDTLRLLTVCNHAFHPDCIDLWLVSHTTCPVCRRNLEPSENSPEKSQEDRLVIPESINEENEVIHDESHSISIKDDEDVGGRTQNMEDKILGHMATDRFSRSHSTGHSIIREEERYTLRLPEHMKEKITRGHNVTGSCITFGDFSGNVTVEKNSLGELSGFSSGNVTRV
ncbi:hypothetical protein GIB67_030158 [Kingdonia uniflora]|uniref:RING-type E3 ubiquitin transferase n=1 Tax=Kingdonia uniflora TaxID=39325 RepID=A0A7J7LE92_9MAGN|nr:hypothetical protein GIB67_030158 [Kingdonia uniflora]